MTRLSIALAKVDALPASRVTDDTSILTLKRLAFEPLVTWDNGHARPGLFGAWRHDATGQRWEFRIRDGAEFHDGTPFVAGHVLDFVQGILASVDMFGMKWSYARYLARTRLSAPDPRTIRVESEHPFADILDVFSEFYVPRLAPDGRATLGTGRYRIADLVPGERAILEAVGPGMGGVARIELDCVPDAAARWLRLVEGRADVAMQLDHIEHPPARDGRWRWLTATSTLSVMYYLNCASGAFASPQARLAANLAVDKDALVRDVFRGLAVPSATIVSPAHLGMATAGVAPIPHDSGRARALVDAAGGPRDLLLRTPTHMPERSPEISRFVAAALERIGFRVTIETETDRPEYARQVGRKRIGDLAIFDSSPHSSFRVLDDKISSVQRAVWWQGYHDDETQMLIAAANAAVAPEAREAAYAACLRRLRENPPWLYIAHPVALSAARPDAPPLALDAKGTLAIG
jgi:peptide/nickel transport system substrate-binding protein